MSDQAAPCALFAVAAVCGAVGQLFLKRGAAQVSAQAPINAEIVLGAACFTAVMLLFIAGYRLGGRIGVVYPFYACTFAIGALLGVTLGGEPWSGLQVAGIAVVLLGVAMVGAGA